jgi:hypothetical protein
MKQKLHFQRFEFKYLITQDQEQQIKKHITKYVRADDFAAQTAGGEYEVISLYYDSPGFYYYKQKVDGAKKRKKIRLRSYRNAGVGVPYCFFEIKRKYNVVILKDRFYMSQSDCEKLIENDDFHSTEAIRDQHRKNIIKEFEWEQHLRSITPKVLIAYTREPFLGKLNENFRVTFDKKIKAVETDNLFYKGNDWYDVSGDMTVMELKFNGSLPFYVRDVIQSLNLSHLSYSKYCEGVDACGSLSVYEQPFTRIKERITNNLHNCEPVWEIF